MTENRMQKILLFFGALLFLLACELPVLATPASSNSERVPIETIVAGTFAAAQTQTAVYLPPATQTSTLPPLPTATPTVTPTSTATIIFIIPTSTKPFVARSAGSQCDLVALTPYNPHVDPGSSVDISWTLKNTGNELWLDTDIDFKHTGGTDMHKNDVYDLPKSLAPKGEVTITVPMVAPKKSGTFTTTWTLAKNKKTLCKVSASIIVK